MEDAFVFFTNMKEQGMKQYTGREKGMK